MQLYEIKYNRYSVCKDLRELSIMDFAFSSTLDDLMFAFVII